VNATAKVLLGQRPFSSNATRAFDNFTQDEADRVRWTNRPTTRFDRSNRIVGGDYTRSGDVRCNQLPFEDSQTYRFNPFDLTRCGPHAD